MRLSLLPSPDRPRYRPIAPIRTLWKGSLLLILLCSAHSPLSTEPSTGEQFLFQLNPEDVLIVNKYQDISIQEPLQKLRREEKNRIVLKVFDKQKERSFLEGSFYTYSLTRGKNREFKHEENFFSRFSIGVRGDYSVPDQYVMPNLRSLPVFPARNITPGEEWQEKAEETMDFRESKLRIPLEVFYTYKGKEQVAIPPEPDLAPGRDATPLPDTVAGQEPSATTSHKISYHYKFVHPVNERNLPIYKIVGSSRADLWFDREQGIPLYDTNHLEYLFFYKTGEIVKFTYDIQSWYRKIRKTTPVEKTETREKIEKELKEDDSLTVREAKEGVVVNMDSILFENDSDRLTDDSKRKLEKVAEILKKYPDREVRISGHTDNRGTDDYNQKLSERRARSVLRELVERYGINSNRLSYKGYGETQPLEDNGTPEGQAKNRRVEFLIVFE